MKGVLMKHSFCDARDCLIEYELDFSNMLLSLHADFISPVLMMEFLERLHVFDERLERVKIIGAQAIGKRFNVTLDAGGARWQVRVYDAGVGEQSKMALDFHPMNGKG